MSSRGLIAYLVTPLARDGHRAGTELFEPYVDRLLERCAPAGIACLANDFPYFGEEERRNIAAAVLRSVRGRVPVHVCTSAIATHQAIALSKHAEDLGAAKVIINPQSYLPLADDQILTHYDRIAKALRIPVHVYNNPAATRTDMSVGLLRRIVDATGARSIKEAGSRVEKFQQLRQEFGDEVVLHVGFHYMALGGFALGASAWDVGLVPSIAAPCDRLYRAAVVDGNLAEAKKLLFALLPLFQFFQEKGALRSLKALGEIDGLELGGTRAPIEMLRSEEIEDLRRRLEQATQFTKGTRHAR